MGDKGLRKGAIRFCTAIKFFNDVQSVLITGQAQVVFCKKGPELRKVAKFVRYFDDRFGCAPRFE